MNSKTLPRILIVTPEITYLPDGMGNMANKLSAKAGGLADVSASLVASLFELGADVHVALPNYRSMFPVDVSRLIGEELRVYKSKLPGSRLHLAEDRAFYYRNSVYSGYSASDTKVAMAFQREVINHVIPTVNPTLIHCNDWMTGLLPAMARRLDIPCLFTVHNIHTREISVGEIEDRGIDAAEFWRYLYFTKMPHSEEGAREQNIVDLLTSGIFSAHFINTVSPTFLDEVARGHHSFVPSQVQHEIAAKREAGCAFGILNAPDPSFDPQTDPRIFRNYSNADCLAGKAENKREIQKRLGLEQSAGAPLFFWPSRLDPVQKGCQLLSEILFRVISDYWDRKLQVVFVANGAYQKHFHEIVDFHGVHRRVAVCDFDEDLSHLAYAASDFIFMPSRFEPCGLPQMIGCKYGSLCVAHDTGGLRDTLRHLDWQAGTGNAFIFEHHDALGLRWAVDQAMDFFGLEARGRQSQISRVMVEAFQRFNHSVTANSYFEIYEKMLKRPILEPF